MAGERMIRRAVVRVSRVRVNEGAPNSFMVDGNGRYTAGEQKGEERDAVHSGMRFDFITQTKDGKMKRVI